MQWHLIKGSLLRARGAAVCWALVLELVFLRSRVVENEFTTTAAEFNDHLARARTAVLNTEHKQSRAEVARTNRRP